MESDVPEEAKNGCLWEMGLHWGGIELLGFVNHVHIKLCQNKTRLSKVLKFVKAFVN